MHVAKSRRPEDAVLRNKAAGCLVGVVIGDAAGMAVSGDSERCRQAASAIIGYQDAVQPSPHPHAGLKRGTTTDEWQVTRASARSLIACRGFVSSDQAREAITEMKQSTVGWGMSTETGVREFDHHCASGGTRGRHPATPVPYDKPAGCGNGVAIKVAPFGVFYGIKFGASREPLATDVLRLGKMTHGDHRACVAGVAVASVIAVLMQRDRLGTSGEVVAALRHAVVPAVSDAERVHRGSRRDIEAFYVRLRKAIRLVRHGADDAALAAELGTTGYALESVPFAIAMFASHPTDFDEALLGAIRAGGNTDAVAAMVGAMIGANVGLRAIPPNWRDTRVNPSVAEAIDLGTRLYLAAA